MSKHVCREPWLSYRKDSYVYPNGTLPEDDFIIESAIVAVLNEYYILQNTLGTTPLALVDNAPIDTNSISVGGLASDSYAGLVFWDAEIWMQPGLAASVSFSKLRFQSRTNLVLSTRHPLNKLPSTGSKDILKRGRTRKHRILPLKQMLPFRMRRLSILGHQVAPETAQ